MYKYQLAFALIATTLAASAQAQESLPEIKITNADYSCPAGFRLAKFSEISKVNATNLKMEDLTVLGSAVCDAAQEWDILRLEKSGSIDEPGGSFGGPGYNCHHFKKDDRGFGGSVCVAKQGLVDNVEDEFVEDQRSRLKSNTVGIGFGPQSPRDIRVKNGSNTSSFKLAPTYDKMNLCNIHLHKSAEHQGANFEKSAGNGNGNGVGTGFVHALILSAAEKEKSSVQHTSQGTGHSTLEPGDTIEVHYVYSTADVKPGEGLGSCFTDAVVNPQLRVEARVFAVVSGDIGVDFGKITTVGKTGNFQQAINIPAAPAKDAVEYMGSTTGPGYNLVGSPYQVSWNVRSTVTKVKLSSIETWFGGNEFKENHPHPVRNLVTNLDLLSPIEQ